MVIGVVFEYAAEPMEVRIDGLSILFRTVQQSNWVTIDNIKLSHSGVIKEFPELEGRDDWKEEAVKRFKTKIKGLKTEKERAHYIIHDLKQHGYLPRYMQVSGFRPIKIE